MGEEITGFDQLDAKLQSILDQSLAKRNKFVAQQAELLNGRVKDNTPVDTGTLRNGWHRSLAAKGAATVYNNTHYAGHVEFGHRIRKRGGGWAKDRKGRTRFVPGAKMLHEGLAETERQFKADAATIMEDLLS